MSLHKKNKLPTHLFSFSLIFNTFSSEDQRAYIKALCPSCVIALTFVSDILPNFNESEKKTSMALFRNSSKNSIPIKTLVVMTTKLNNTENLNGLLVQNYEA